MGWGIEAGISDQNYNPSQDSMLRFGHIGTRLGGNSQKISKFVFTCTQVTVAWSLSNCWSGGQRHEWV